MKTRKVITIIHPYPRGLPLNPSVTTEDRITYAIELMVKNNVRCIAVVRNHVPIGMIRLEDAFKELGLQLCER
ncbi:MAG: CBS domain-containing protein [Desulfobacterales bacterium]|jgi:CBS domain-containing protein|nr:MAG: CBS domain-containing protein [Desulfobacterales bacterium]